MDDIGDDLVVAAAGQLQLDAVDRPVPRRHDQAEKARHRPDRPALHEQRDQHDDEGDVEEDRCPFGQAGDHRQDGEQDRDRAAQADPGDEGHLLAG